jgi:hypothetical protein
MVVIKYYLMLRKTSKHTLPSLNNRRLYFYVTSFLKIRANLYLQ